MTDPGTISSRNPSWFDELTIRGCRMMAAAVNVKLT